VDFPNRFLQKTTILYFTEIRLVGALFIHVEGRADGQIEWPDENKHFFRDNTKVTKRKDIYT